MALSVGVLVFVVCILIRLLAPRASATVLQDIAKPFWNLRQVTSQIMPSIAGYFTSKNALVKENQMLQTEGYNLQVKNLELSGQLVGLANPDLIKLTHKPDMIITKVLAAPPYVPFDILHLDQGQSTGISMGKTVYSGSGIELGVVNQVSASGSMAILFSSPGYVSQATVLRTGLVITLTGSGNANFSTSLPKDTDVVVGDLLVDTTATQNVKAQVYYVDVSTDGSFKRVLSRIPVDVFSESWVGISK